MTDERTDMQVTGVDEQAAQSRARVLLAVPEMCHGRDNVLESQVLGLGRTLARMGRRVMVVASSPSTDAAHTAIATETAVAEGLDLVTVPVYPKTPGYFSLLLAVRRTMRKSILLMRAFDPDIIYTRNPMGFRATRSFAKRCNARTVYDARALVFSEAAYRGRPLPIVIGLRWQERQAVRRADRVACVSRVLRAWIGSNFRRYDVEVVPCCVESSALSNLEEVRASIRRHLGWPADAPVIAYCGGLDRWQRVGDVVTLVADLLRARPSMRALFLVSNPAKICEFAGAHDIDPSKYEVREVPHAQVGEWLAASDFGLILREDVLVNQVSSPIKISEYLAAGLTVICTRNIGDLSELVSTRGVGLSLDLESIQDWNKLLNLIDDSGNRATRRQMARAIAREQLQWDAHVETLQRLFSPPGFRT